MLTTASIFDSTYVAFAALVLGFSFVIFVHELGHFMVARWVGIKCTQFAIGMGHAIFCYRRGMGVRFRSTEAEYEQLIKNGADPATLGETEYRIGWLPLGGYVKMMGQEDMDPTASSADPRAFNNKTVGQRMAVISAGVIMNLIFAAIFFLVAFMFGVNFPPAIVGGVVPDSPAATTAAAEDPKAIGLQPGDEVLKLNGQPPSDFTSVQAAAALAGADDRISLAIRRPAFEGQAERTLTFHLSPAAAKGPNKGLRYLGVMPPDSLVIPDEKDLRAAGETEQVYFRMMLQKMGLKPGASLTAVDGKPVEYFWQLDRHLQSSSGKPLKLTFSPPPGDAGAPIVVDLQPQTDLMFLEPADDTDEMATVIPHMLGLQPPVKVDWIRDDADSPSKGKLMEGDIFISVGDLTWPTSSGQIVKIVSASSDQPLKITVLRNNEPVDLTITPRDSRSFVSKLVGGKTGGKLGVSLRIATDSNRVAGVLPDSPFKALNFKPGTEILKFNDAAIANYSDLRRAMIAAGPGQGRVTARLPLAGSPVEADRPVTMTQLAIEGLGKLNWNAELPAFLELRTLQQADSVGQAMSMGLEKTHLFITQTYLTLLRLVQGWISPSKLSGPVGIAHLGTKFAKRGWTYLLFFLGLISVNLAVINFLPFPVVDGGHFVFLCLEKIRGKPVSMQLQAGITYIGLACILSFFVFVTFHDIVRLLAS